jgi:penicillin-binding protein 1A
VLFRSLPKRLIQAFLATEDDRFFRHHGVDWEGILRAAMANLKAGGIRQGASTITMQVARDMFLTPRRDMKRKMSEIYISLLMEAEFTKEEIFSLYVNKIFLGQRAYGVGAAAEVYFGKTLDQLTVAEMATLAGIPTAPSLVNPVANAEAARTRRAHVLGRMLELNYITQAEYDEAKNSPMESRLHGSSVEAEAPYMAEMVRNEMQAKYGDGVYTAGYKVYTTIDSRLQAAATVALRTGLLEYDRRHYCPSPALPLPWHRPSCLA